MPKENDLHLKLLSPSDIKPASLDLDAVRKKLAGAQGPRYWRTLEELANEKAFGELLEREFPRQASEWVDPVSRRSFLKLAGASLALAGLSGCTKQPPEAIVPYVRQPEELVLGKPLYYATAMPFAGHALPLLVTSHEYRPTKIEGNAKHGASLGSTDLFAQASILDLYDPDRSTTVMHRGEPKAWGDFLSKLAAQIKVQRAIQGAGLRFLTGAVSSPTLGWQMKAILQQFPQAKWRRYDPVHRDHKRAGSKMAFGAYYDAVYDFSSADIVVSLDADFLSGSWCPGFLRYARDFMSSRRRKLVNDKEMNRLYVAESSPSTTGAKADHRLVLRPSEVERIAHTLASKLGVAGASAAALIPERQKWVDAVTVDLINSRGKSVIIPGEFSSPAVHVLACAMNAALGNAGQTVKYIEPVEVDVVEHTQSIRELADDLNAGKVDLLVMMGVNPAYDAPADLNFKDVLRNAAANSRTTIVQLSQYQNETTDFCHWHIPEAHYLESWSDVRAYDGTASIIQPLIMPLYDGKGAHELLAPFEDLTGATAYDRVRAYWQTQHKGDDFEQWWRRQLHEGWVADSTFPARPVTLKPVALPAPADSGDDIDIIFRPDPTIYDGKFVNNGWLQETPKPLTRTTWDNVAMISPAMAERMHLNQLDNNNDHQSDAQNVLEIEFQGKTVKAPYWPQPGHPDNAITLFLGYGQEKSGRVGKGAGYNAYSVRPSSAQYFGRGAKIEARKEYWSVAVTQGHFSMENRDPVKAVTLAEYKEHPQFAHEGEIEPKKDANGDETLYPDFRNSKEFYQDYAWGMAIDLNSCIGCQACAVACQSENNISIVGKEQVQRGREMQWIRIDAYYEGDPANPNVHFQPVPCMQCENAPCEPVCPVGATLHSTEGLNDMVYNRCVGTRYCSNNCPYKVRRFNFLLYADFETPSLKMMRNPDVSVRSRGVMEKCTYCVQRINAARIQAEVATEKEGRPVRIEDSYGGPDAKAVSIKTACEQVCPTEAIVFGNINDKNSRVSQIKADSRNYSLLAELNTRPRTTYIGAVRNPNPDLKPGEKKA
ncbi:MAG TPA: TAT-variant-translocated molybdopterin oxidoreductase [Candidatus Angelobacter sp.]|nr:TAT-variant-translocated molybdopterin oxidoreductase [Candidatus Angelobacter sp.]